MQKIFEDELGTVLDFEEIIARTHDDNVKIWKVKENSKYFALKAILRKSIDTEEKMTHLYNERNSLREFSHSGIVKLIKTLKDAEYLYLLLELCYGISLEKLIRLNQRFSVNFTKFITSQIIMILSYIHSIGYIYRDLKLSNIIIDGNGRLKLLDFGFCKKIELERTNSFCGTIHAMAPEFFEDPIKEYAYEIDFYALGVMIFEMLVGSPPFGYESKNLLIREHIKEGIKVDILSPILPNSTLIDLLLKLLEKDNEKRLNSWEIVKNHAFFKEIDWTLCEKFMNSQIKNYEFYPESEFENYNADIEQAGIFEKKELNDEELKAKDIFENLF